MSFKHHWLARYVAAVAAVGAGFLLRLGLTALVGPDLATYVTFYPAVMLSALLGGLGPGLLATIAAALGVDYFILPPHEAFGITTLSDAVGLAFFTGMGVFMSVVAELYRRARQKAAGHDTDLLRREVREAPPHRFRQGWLLNAGLVVALAILAMAGWQSVRHMRGVEEAERWETHTYLVIQEWDRLLSALKDAETGQRGYLITGEEKYLEPYQAALGLEQTNLASLKQLTQDNPRQQQRLANIEALLQEKLAELKQTIELRRAQGLPAAIVVVDTGKGKAVMDQIRKQVAEAEDEEARLLEQRTAAKRANAGKTLQALLAGGVLSFLLLVTVFLFLKQENARRMKAEAELRRHEADLQGTVAARTADLSHANESLRQQREWLKVTLSSIGDAVLATDTSSHITFLNPVAVSLTGWEEKEALGQPVQSVFRIINDETRVAGEDIVARVLREGRAVALANHTALVARDGREVPIEDSAAPIKDSAGTVSGVVLVFHDVTERRRAQAAVRESERQFRTLADSIPNLAWWANSDGYITWYNRRWYEYTGTTPEQMEGWGWQSVHDPQALPGVLKRWKASIATGAPFEMTFPLRGADGVFRPFLTRVMPLKDAQGHVQQWFGTNTDVSEQKRTEEAQARLAAIVESSDDAILSKDLDGDITSWNVGAERLFGYRPAEVIGRSIRLLLPAERQDEEDQIMGRLRAGERVDHFETVRLTKDGHSLVVSVTASPLRDGEGHVIGASKIVRDITERKQAEEAERQLNAELRQRVAELQAANTEVQASRRAALSLAEDALEARKQAEQASADLRSAAEQRRLALEAADLGAWDYHFQTGEVYWDERCREMWGVPQAEQIDYAGAIAAVHPEDRVGVDEAVKQALGGKSGGAYHREFRVVWPDSSVHWIASHGRVYFQGEGDQRRAVRFTGANQDITERKQREEDLQRLNRTLRAHSKSDQALMRAQNEAEYLEAACRIVLEDCGHAMVWVGFAEEDEGKTVRPAAQAGFEEGYLETLRITWADTERGRGPTGTAIRTGQPNTCRNMLTDPRFAPWRSEAIKRGYASSLVLPLMADGRAFGALTIYSRQPDGFGADEVKLLTDLASDMAYGITALRLREAKARAEDALRQTAEDLRRSNRDLEQFAYVASHDLQEPLRAVGGYVKLLQHRFPDKLDGKARDYIAGAFEGATRMERLITDLLAYSRVGTHGGSFASADLQAVLERALDNLAPAITAAQATITHDALPALSVDVTQIMQLFQNLIGNALKFHGESPPRIHVGAQSEPGRWVFSVRDNGIGIEPQYYEKIFHIFQRLHTRKDYPGTGIGLAICKRIVERHGGTIWVESQPGQGSTFFFAIPDSSDKREPAT